MTKPNYKPDVELWDIDKITPYDKNAKIHTENQIKSLVEVIKTQGWDVPIVVDKDGVIIKGHGRRLAAMSMGLKKVPVIVRRDMTDNQVKAARLSDNRVAMGDFDVNAIKDELEALRTDGFDLSTMGFDEKEVSMMLGDLDSLDFDAFDQENTSPDAPSQPQSDAEQQDEGKPKEKPVALTDALGFKHVPAEFKDDLIEFQSMADNASEAKGAEAFCLLIRNLLKGMTPNEATGK